MSARAALTTLAMSASLACSAPGPQVPFRVIALGPDPFFAGTITDIAVTFERDGVRDDASTVRFAPGATTLPMPPMPYGEGYAIIVETELHGLVLARGRSFPFAVTALGSDRSPDVTLGALGRFAAVARASESVERILPTAEGALLASEHGVARFVAHGPDGRSTIAARTDWPADRVGGAPASLADGVLVVGGASAGATLFAADGAVLGTLDASIVRVVDGAALVEIDATSVLVAGGRQSDGTLLDDAVRITWDGATLAATRLTSLPWPRADARAILMSARIATGVVPRVLLIDGVAATGPASGVVLVDPTDTSVPRSVLLDVASTGAAVAPLDTGLVLVAGGRDATDTVSSAVSILVVHPDDDPPVALLSPPPRPLFRAREHAEALPLGAGIALVVGGVDGTGAPVAEAEIADVQLDSLPGNLVLTDSVAAPGAPSAVARLRDRSVLVSSGDAVSIYFPPRGD